MVVDVDPRYLTSCTLMANQKEIFKEEALQLMLIYELSCDCQRITL